ncbi:MAG: hypothetical protein K9I95_01340 [Flavobacteriaceae bacterium]|nr:hypothetical protein [Flavobacteriaceae bacterium]
MKKSNQHKKDISRLHKDKLGMNIPEDFFSKSKEDILNKVLKQDKPKQSIFWLRTTIAYPIAASIILLFAITIWMKNNNQKINNQITNTEYFNTMNPDFFDSDFLISSLMVPDKDIDNYLDYYLINKVVIEAELSEQQLENIFINSLFVEDSLVDDYLNKNLIENIVI